MDTAKKAIEIFSEAERRMRELVGVAASAGEYELAICITEWSKALSDLARSAQEQPRGGSPHRTAESGRPVAFRRTRRVRTAKKASRRPTRAGKKNQYPRFVRRNDSLVKIAWSKTQRTEYEHKAPRRVMELLASALVARGGNGKLVAADDVMPLVDPHDGTEIPSYQAYLTLAWLRHEGLVQQEGRQGYIVPVPASLESSAQERWASLSNG